MKIINEYFDSPEKFASHLKSYKAKWQWINRDSFCNQYSQSRSVEHALEMFEEGWTEQAQKMTRLQDDIFAQLSKGAERYDPVMVECDGQFIDVAAFVTGEPEHWVRFESQLSDGVQSRILKIAVNVNAGWNTSEQTIVARGTLVTSLIEALEFRGYRCELLICCPTTNFKCNYLYSHQIMAKPADQPLNLARVLFMAAHPAMLRRLDFAMLASNAEAKEFGATSDEGNFGLCAELPETKDFDIYLPLQLTSQKPVEWTNPQAAQRWLKAQIEKIETPRQ